MEDLQEKVGGVQVEGRDEAKPVDYQGLNLVESVVYNGGTSVMYWM